MIRWNYNTAMFAGFALIMVSNTVALTGVYYNRSGDADSTITMTQRELELPYYYNYGLTRENSAVSLQLNWRINDDRDYPSVWGNPDWLDKKKLAELGFDTSIAADDKRAVKQYRKMLPREAYIVLEYNGPAYQKQLQRLEKKLATKKESMQDNPKSKQHRRDYENTKDRFESERDTNSRLFVVDADLDADKLRNKYPDRTIYIIAKGEISLEHYVENKKKPAYISGYIKAINIAKINVPYSFRKLLDPWLYDNDNRKDIKYQVTVAYGKRHEPWIQDLQISRKK